MEKVYDHVIACSSLKENLANDGGGRFRIEATQGGFFCGRKRRGAVEEGCQEGVQRRKAEKKER